MQLETLLSLSLSLSRAKLSSCVYVYTERIRFNQFKLASFATCFSAHRNAKLC